MLMDKAPVPTMGLTDSSTFFWTRCFEGHRAGLLAHHVDAGVGGVGPEAREHVLVFP